MNTGVTAAAVGHGTPGGGSHGPAATTHVGEMRARQQRTGQWHGGQLAGRRFAAACVSLEVTQRCNLDCTLCYLSDSAEAVRDFPLEEIFRRIDAVHARYGPGTDVQVSGGEPTLRRRDELVAIVARIAALGMRASLFTNGIKASRELLRELCEAGLTDVAFHVDTTQQRSGHNAEGATGVTTEAQLNPLRLAYIERARGLPLSVFFNTTVHAGNFAELPALAAFFVAQAHAVRLASFQLQAETGRGVLGARDDVISNDSVGERLRQGVGVPVLGFNVLQAGHHDCNRAAVLLVVNGRAHDAFADAAFVQRFMQETVHLGVDRRTPWRSLKSLARAAASRPALARDTLRWMLGWAWRLRGDLLRARGRVHKLTLFTHNFMDACQLDDDRVEACVFMAVTQDGPLSMCAYNARRDAFLLKPLQTAAGTWQPLREGASPSGPAAAASFPIKWLKGRPRAAALAARSGPPEAESPPPQPAALL